MYRANARRLVTSRMGRGSLSPVKRFASSSTNNSKAGYSFGVLSAVAFLSAGLSFYSAKEVYGRSQRTTSIQRDWIEAKYGGRKEFDQAWDEFVAVLGKDGISVDEEDLKIHGYSDWSTYNIDSNPIAVAYPTSTEQVSEIAKICHKYRLPMIGFSGGSSLEGNFCAPHGGICIDFMHMNKVLQVRPDDLDVTVQPAVGWMELNEYLANNGYSDVFFGVDPGPTAKIGGMINTCCSGTNCVKYGPMRDHIINLTVVLADGTIIKTKQRPRKSAAGYNLNHIFCGTEGTLGLVTEATLKLQVVPEETTVAICPFPTVHDATSAAMKIIRNGIPVHAIELMDDRQMWVINRAGYTVRKWEETPTLFFKFSGSKTFVKEQIAHAKKITKQYQGRNFEFATSETEKHQLWSARKEVLWSNLAMGPKNGKSYSTDVAVPMSKLADLVMATKKDIEDSGIFGTTLGHIGDGNFHAGIVYTDEDEELVKQVAENIVHRGLALEGTCTGEHGIGAGKLNYLVEEIGADSVSVMNTIKLALDPLQLLNPGKIFTKESLAYGREREAQGNPPHKIYQFTKSQE